MIRRLSGTHRLGSVLDELPFWDLADGVVFLEDGRMEVGLEVQPPSPLFASGAALARAWPSLKALLRLGVPEGERARVLVEAVPADGEALRRYAAGTVTADPLLARLAEAKVALLEAERLGGHLLDWRCYLSCTLSPTAKRAKGSAFAPSELTEALARAHALRERLHNLLENAGYAPQPMASQEVFGLIWRYLNPGLVPARAPRFLPFEGRAGYLPAEALADLPDIQTPTLKRQLAASPVENSDPRHLVMGERYVATVAFQGMPDETETGMIRRVLERAAGASFYLVLDYQHEPYGPSSPACKPRPESSTPWPTPAAPPIPQPAWACARPRGSSST